MDRGFELGLSERNQSGRLRKTHGWRKPYALLLNIYPVPAIVLLPGTSAGRH